MPEFVWEGQTPNGEQRSGEMNADDRSEVQRRLRSRDIQPTEISKKGSLFDVSLADIPVIGGVPTSNVVTFTRQFATMIDAGLPLVQALDLLAEAEPHDRFQEILKAIKEDVESGSTLSDAMAKHPRAFDELYCSLVEAGEVGGILDNIMERLADQMEKSQQLRRKVRGAFTYPIAVSVIAVAVVIVMLYFVIPTFESMFQDMGGGELPGATQFVIGISEFVQNYILWILLGLIGATAGGYSLWRYEPSRKIIDRGLLRMPVLGPLIRKTAVARFTRTLGTMVSSGVPIIDALEIVSRTAGNKEVERAIMYTREEIAQGQNIVDPLSETGVFPDLVVQMIGVGESTGELDQMLQKIADFYEDEVDVAVDNLTSLLEPALMVFLGIVVGGLLIAMYLPIFTLAGNLQGMN